MDYHKLWELTKKNFSAAFSGLLLGIIGTYIAFDALVVASKNTHIATLTASVQAEKGRQDVLNDRIKLIGDRAVLLETQLKYKPETQKARDEQNKVTIERLKVENAQLYKIKDSFEELEGNNVDIAELNIKLKQYMIENTQLKAEVAHFKSDTIVKNKRIYKGSSWTGLGGRITIGLSDVENDYKLGYTAQVVSSIYDFKRQELQAGYSSNFKLNDADYILVINKVAYVGDYIEFSVYKKI
ncbi:hypothetical protein [Aliivibrio sifiae]|uniref:Uncharacterized protein n=1 Tax=Aliivibrio sifiae TaxID=566293 RepID=A0A2S7X7X0_9GAMM|nr:hypothetical protein [Aliivibrio sifiae]PQJ87463.1 hypothetical protein BTO23_15240 [Aliivibrio sifiae]GLR77176.1 hypothetical protein GCM10007855_40510 [Aliivibrio sifiae]